MSKPSFRESLCTLINHHSIDSEAGTPDCILAILLFDCLESFDRVTEMRDKWHGFKATRIRHATPYLRPEETKP